MQQENKAVSLAVRYYQSFPKSEISIDRLLRSLWDGAEIDWNSGALYFAHMGLAATSESEEEEGFYGTPVSSKELLSGGIKFMMRDKESPFKIECVKGDYTEYERRRLELDLPSEEEHFKLICHGELKGLRVIETEDKEGSDVLEPLTIEEAVDFLCRAFCPPHDEETKTWFPKAVAVLEKRSQQLMMVYNTRLARLQVMLQEAVACVEDKLADASRHNAKLKRLGIKEGKIDIFDQLKLDKQLWFRARASATRWNINESWSYASRYFFGERHGITHGREELNDQLFLKQDQEHLPGERIDGEYLLHEAEELARNTDIFQILYTFVAWDRKMEVFKRIEAADHGPCNSGWAERSVYLLRCERRRDEYFAKKLWRFLTWPLAVIAPALKKLEAEYLDDIRQAAPGPGKAHQNQLTERQLKDIKKLGWHKEGSSWHNVPLYGKEAVAWLRQRGQLGRLAGKPVHPNFRVVLGEHWHKTRLRKEQFEALKQVAEERLAHPHRQGLPLDYVMRRYG